MEKTNVKNEIHLLNAQQLSKILNISKRQVFRLNNFCKIPAPIRIGGSVRWVESTILKWLAAGAPDRQNFEEMQEVDND